jgi:hypothetical protein
MGSGSFTMTKPVAPGLTRGAEGVAVDLSLRVQITLHDVLHQYLLVVPLAWANGHGVAYPFES